MPSSTTSISAGGVSMADSEAIRKMANVPKNRASENRNRGRKESDRVFKRSYSLFLYSALCRRLLQSKRPTRRGFVPRHARRATAQCGPSGSKPRSTPREPPLKKIRFGRMRGGKIGCFCCLRVVGRRMVKGGPGQLSGALRDTDTLRLFGLPIMRSPY